MIDTGNKPMILKPSLHDLASRNTGKQYCLNHSSSEFLRFVHTPGSIIQVFVKGATACPHTHLIGYYDTDNLEKLHQHVQTYSGRANGIYYGLNPVPVSLHWYRRDRILPFPALMGLLAAFSVSTPLVWFVTSLYATPESLASLNWPQHAMPSVLVALICPVMITWLCMLEYSHANTLAASQ